MTHPTTYTTHYPSLAQLQQQQLEHDREYSRDLMGMTEKRRMEHYSLHQGKYAGRLMDFDPKSPKFSFERIVTDSFLVTLAMANSLKLNLAQELTHRPAMPFNIRTPKGLAMQLAVPTGKLAEALLDYKEPKPGLFNWLARQLPAARRQRKSVETAMKDATLAFMRIHAGVSMGLSYNMDQLVTERQEMRARTSIHHPLHGVPLAPNR